MTNLSYISIDAIKGCYAPYHKLPAFEAGFAEGMGARPCRYFYEGVDKQAHDRGLEAAMKVQRLADWVENNVGSD